MSRALTLHSGSALQAAKRWVDLTGAERKRRAIEALNLRDAATLIDLTVSHLHLWGKAGATVSVATTRSYACGIRTLLADTQAENLLHLKPSAAAVWIRTLEGRGLSPSTVSVRLAAARSLYAALRWADALSIDPFQDVKPARDKRAAWDRRQPYAERDIEALLAAADIYDRALILVCYHAGLRIFEALALTWEAINLPARRLTVACGKGRKRREQLLSVSLASALRALPRNGAYVFPFRSQEQARARLKRLCAVADVQYLGCHSLRHAAGTKLMAQTRDLDAVARFLGHAQVETSRIYSKFADDTLSNTVGGW